MAKFLETVKELFGTTDLYEVLSLKKDAQPTSIRRAYYALSLKVHPDRVTDNDDDEKKKIATTKFQTLSRIYSILSDSELKTIYDDTGMVDGFEKIENEKDWSYYWRILFKKIDVDDIKNFELKYKNSEEELHDLKTCYIEYEGDMDRIMESVLCCDINDEERFRKIILAAIESDEVPSYPAFVDENEQKQSIRKRKAMKEAKEAEELRQQLSIGNLDNDDNLKAMILKQGKGRAERMTSFLDDLESKYAPKPKSGKAAKRQKKK